MNTAPATAEQPAEPNDEELRAVVDDAMRSAMVEIRDAERFRWLTEDHADRSTRAVCREILERMGGMGYGAACAAIDNAITGTYFSPDIAATAPAPVAPEAPEPQASSRDERMRAAMEEFDSTGHYPGMIAAFERQFGQAWTDSDWRQEASVWAAAWCSALAAPQPANKAMP